MNNREKSVKYIEKRLKCKKPQKNRQNYRKIIKNVQKLEKNY